MGRPFEPAGAVWSDSAQVGTVGVNPNRRRNDGMGSRGQTGQTQRPITALRPAWAAATNGRAGATRLRQSELSISRDSPLYQPIQIERIFLRFERRPFCDFAT